MIPGLKRVATCLAIFSTFSTMAQPAATPADERIKLLRSKKQLEQQSLVSHVAFRNIGPTVMSGRVVDVEVNPADPTEFYVAYATGGLWHTVNNGQSFTPIFDSAEVIVLGDIAVNWTYNPRVIWLGTGEVNSSRSSYAGIGVYKSVNNGKTWTHLGLPESHHIGKIQLHPQDVNTAWVAVMGHLYSPNKERGVYKTADGGKTWKQTLFIDENTGAIEIEINPQKPDELYAATWYRTRRAWNFEEGSKSSGIYKSRDGGETWQLLSTPQSGFLTGDSVGRIGLSVYPKDPTIIYAVVDNNYHRPDTAKADTSKYILRDFRNLTKEQFLALDDRKLDSFIVKSSLPKRYSAASLRELIKGDKLKPTAIWEYFMDANASLFETPVVGCEVYRSNDGGVTWKKTNKAGLNLYSSYGYYFGKIWVSPSNADKVIIAGIDMQMSTDGGKTFKKMDKENVHADHHACWINPARDNHIISGNDGGINITYDNGDHWFKANSPPVGQFYAINVDNEKPYNVYGGLQDNGSWWGPSTHKESYRWLDVGDYPFKSLNGGDGMQVQIDSRDNRTIYSGFQFGYYWRMQRGGKERKAVRPQHDLGDAALRFNWQTPIHLSRHNQDIFYIGSNKLHRSLNKGDSITVMSTDLTTNPKQGDVPYGTITAIHESPLRFGLLYIGTDDGQVHVSKDGGYTFANVSAKLPKGLWVSSLQASAHKESRVYLALNGYRSDHFSPYVYVSEDFGASWALINKKLPAEPVNVIREDAKHDSLLYVGTDGGLYVTIDKGLSWMLWNNGLPKSIPVHDIAIQPSANEIVLGTHGRSLYIAKLDSVQLLLQDKLYLRKLQQSKPDMEAFLRDLPIPAKKGKVARRKEGVDIDCPPH